MIKFSIDKQSEQRLKRILSEKERKFSQRAYLQDVGAESLKPLERIAKDLVEVDTGELRDSIRIEKEDNGAVLFTDAPHAASVEYLDRPYMRPAAQKQQEAINKASELFKKEAEKT